MEKSNVTIKSNIYPLSKPNERIIFDMTFLSKIDDPEAVAELKRRRLKTTRRQDVIFHSASLHCEYAAEGDYPFGTIIESFGEKTVEKSVCKCRYMHNGECNPDYCLPSFKF